MNTHIVLFAALVFAIFNPKAAFARQPLNESNVLKADATVQNADGSITLLNPYLLISGNKHLLVPNGARPGPCAFLNRSWADEVDNTAYYLGDHTLYYAELNPQGAVIAINTHEGSLALDYISTVICK